ncbi:MAG: DUF1330 domain-containing protein [Pseudolabrys sp.]|jgi:uncharacterized protein (DUF1330 family)
MPAYWIGEHDITDAEKFAGYLRQAIPIIERFGGRYLTRAGSHDVLEGHWQPNRVAVIEFPDMATLKAFYRAAEYQPLIALRQESAKDMIIAADGV